MSLIGDGWIDVSVTVRHGMPHWPDNPPIVLERTMDVDTGRRLQRVAPRHGRAHRHHMDGPVHFVHGDAPGSTRCR